MTKNLLIVESPAKAKTLNKYLGKDFKIVASYGHVRDLIPKSGAIDTNDNFTMKYQIIERNKKHIDNIIKEAKNCQNIYLATDPDREGEAISWHIDEILKKKIKNDISIKRVTFNEITKSSVVDAIQSPREISINLVDAQQTRRALDYLVGFNLSPLLWKKIRKGLSAGRVQSPSLRMICEREIEIKNFVSQEYWSIHLLFNKNNLELNAKLHSIDDNKISQLSITSEEQKNQIMKCLTDENALVTNIERKKRKRKTIPPFTTSTLQQESVKKLNFSTDKTMRLAQQLYEGINIQQDEILGLITYMRTDSVSLSQEAVNEIREYITQNFDKKYLPNSANTFKNKSKNAQEAHEAIRPTNIFKTPQSLKPFLNEDAYKLYDMIWKRTLACQMSDASFENTAIDIKLNNAIFRLTGQIQIFDGFLNIYQESDHNNESNIQKLPNFDLNEIIPVKKLYAEKHFTQPPARFSEASLVKDLEEYGIGRPSTYANIISTLKDREYVIVEQKRFIPTDTGVIVNKFLTEHFNKYVDYDFTANLENDLDKIANGNKKWLPIMKSFWKNFSKNIKEKENISRETITSEQLDEICPKCKKHNLVIKYGKKGKFIGCKGYPECDYTRNINQTEENVQQIIEDRPCPKCGGQLMYKIGRYGKFIACKNYPKCDYKESLVKPKDTGIICPQCNKGTLLEKKSKYGKMFYACSQYPTCKYTIWNKPVQEKCPKCNWPILTIKETKKNGKEKLCPQKECGYMLKIDD